jgi:hypothetical protein
MRKPLDNRAPRRAWTGVPSAGESAFPEAQSYAKILAFGKQPT